MLFAISLIIFGAGIILAIPCVELWENDIYKIALITCLTLGPVLYGIDCWIKHLQEMGMLMTAYKVEKENKEKEKELRK